jgi:hypothetical protein
MSMQEENITEQFLKDVKNHTVKVLYDVGLYRHYSASNNNSSIDYFEVLTYPGGIMIRGDRGVYVWERNVDSLEWFKTSDINYLATKVVAVDKCSTVWEYSHEEFIKIFTEELKEFFDDKIPENIQESLETLQTEFVTTKDNVRDVLDDFVNENNVRNEYGVFDVDESVSHIDADVLSYSYIWATLAVKWLLNRISNVI